VGVWVGDSKKEGQTKRALVEKEMSNSATAAIITTVRQQQK
jgi:hypothetical protein